MRSQVQVLQAHHPSSQVRALLAAGWERSRSAWARWGRTPITLLCVPHSLSEPVGLALGAQAGEQRLRKVMTAAGFGRFRRVAQTPFNLIYEARP
jgi:hypothetical protein